MYTCVILHNMIIEENDRAISEVEEDYLANQENLPGRGTRTWDERVAATLRIDGKIRDKRVHNDLRNALIDTFGASRKTTMGVDVFYLCNAIFIIYVAFFKET